MLLVGAGRIFAQSPQVVAEREAVRTILLNDVRQIAAPGLVGTLVVSDARAVVVVAGRSGKNASGKALHAPVIAAGFVGAKGRVVAFAHDGYFGADALRVGETAKLLANSVRWASAAYSKTRNPSTDDPRVGVWKLLSDPAGVVDALKRHGLTNVLSVNRPDDLAKCDVLVGVFSQLSEPEREAAQMFLQNGGGLVGAETGWGWLSLNESKTLAQNGGSALFRGAGIQFAGGMAEKTSAVGFDPSVYPKNGAYLNAHDALRALETDVMNGDAAAQCIATLTQATQILPDDDKAFLPALNKLVAGHEPMLADGWGVSLAQPLDRLAMTLSVQRAMRLPANQVTTAHPSARSFPGAVLTIATRHTISVRVNTNISGWHSTGAYAAPGEQIRVTLPLNAPKQNGLRVRIGAHSDTLWHLETWKRAPEITRTFALDKETTVAANPFGGAVFIEVSKRAEGASVAVTIANAVRAPLFVRGQTTMDEWRQSRAAPAPWAEMVGKRVALTVPSSVVRNLENSEALMAYWDDVMLSCAKLYTVPISKLEPQRYCADRQISAGYMHSGYPIMTSEDVAARFVDLAVLTARDGLKNWGFYHEVGHNFQVRDGTFDGCGEVTNNLFSLYACEIQNGVRSDDYGAAHPAMRPEAVRERRAKYFANGSKFEEWKNDPFLALTMYVEVRQALGWEPFTKVFAEYAALPAVDRPRNDNERRDQWLIRLSRATGRNLVPFFAAWGVPTSKTAQQKVAALNLPVWMPVIAARR